MKVLIFGGFLDHTWSPIEQRYLWLDQALREGGGCDWLVPVPEHGFDENDIQNLPTYAAKLKEIGANLVFLPLAASGRLQRFKAIWRVLAASDADVIYTHFGNLKLLVEIVARLQGRRVIRGEHNFAFEAFRRGRILKRLFWRYVPNRFVAVSQAVADHLQENGVAAKKISVVHDGFDFSLVDNRNRSEDRQAILQELKLDIDSKLLLCVAKLSRGKRQDVLVDMLARLDQRNVHLLLVGENVEPDYTEAMLANLGPDQRDRIKLLGYRTDIPRLMSASDLFFLPSVSEGLGNVVIEALSVGTPAIVSDLPALREIVVDGQNGKIAKTGTADEYASIASTLLETRDVWHRLAENGRLSVREKFGKDMFVENTCRALVI